MSGARRAPRRPIVLIGAGGIARHAHLPAYRKAGRRVAAVYDVRAAAARETAAAFGIERVCSSLEEAASVADAVFDVAVPADRILHILPALPDGAAVLIQKPMGRDLREAGRILALCRRKRLVAAVNFQLRFAPNVVALRRLVELGSLGELREIEVRVHTRTPWELWPFLRGIPRLEILYHSIHYIDLIRSFFGEPRRASCWIGRNPGDAQYADVRSTTLLDYGPHRRALVTTDHQHQSDMACSELRVEGTRGAAVARMGVNLDYPRGVPDTLEVATLDRRGRARRRRVAVRGSWFPDAFRGPMETLMRRADDPTAGLPTSVEDAIRTMRCVEACYKDAARGR